MATTRKTTGRESAPSLMRTGVYTALGAALVGGAGLITLMILNPPPKVTGKSPCSCGCKGAKTTASAAKVYGG